MTRIKTCLASLLLAASLSAGCGAAVTTTNKPVPQHTQIDRAAVRAKLAARRDKTFARFLAYREARVYPINNLPGGGIRHVWIDDWGNLCAAATLISADWGRDAATMVGASNRELKLADVKSGAVMDWILTSGLTKQELVAIQLPGDEITMPIDQDARDIEIARMHGIYVDVERQMKSLWNANLEAAVDALMRRPDLARELLRDKVAGPGEFAQPVG